MKTNCSCFCLPRREYCVSITTGRRGDFLGQATIAWDDLEAGRELDLTLMEREGFRSGSVKGTIKLRVGEPMIEKVENALGVGEASVVGGVAAAAAASSSVAVGEKEDEKVYRGMSGEQKEVCGLLCQKHVDTVVYFASAFLFFLFFLLFFNFHSKQENPVMMMMMAINETN